MLKYLTDTDQGLLYLRSRALSEERGAYDLCPPGGIGLIAMSKHDTIILLV